MEKCHQVLYCLLFDSLFVWLCLLLFEWKSYAVHRQSVTYFNLIRGNSSLLYVPWLYFSWSRCVLRIAVNTQRVSPVLVLKQGWMETPTVDGAHWRESKWCGQNAFIYLVSWLSFGSLQTSWGRTYCGTEAGMDDDDPYFGWWCTLGRS